MHLPMQSISAKFVFYVRISHRFGSCELFDAPSELCSSVYDASKFVYVQDTTQTALATTLDNTVSTELFEERCKEPIARILCQFFLPPCGANNVTYLPTAICSEECLEVQNECSRDWNVSSSNSQLYTSLIHTVVSMSL